MQIIVPDNYSANCCSGQLNFSSCSPSIELLQVVVLETLFANYTIQCLGQFICKFCKLSSRPGYFFANYRTHCSGFFFTDFVNYCSKQNFIAKRFRVWVSDWLFWPTWSYIQVKVGHWAVFCFWAEFAIANT